MVWQKNAARTEAVARGLKRYFTGEPCVNGHIAARSVLDWKCVVCKKERHDKWRVANPEKVQANHDRWVEKDPEAAAALARKRTAKSKLKHLADRRAADRERAKRWRRANPDLVRERNAGRSLVWSRANPSKNVAKTQRYLARLRSAPGTFTADDIDEQLERQGYRCNGCGCDLLRRFHVDHITPLIRGGSNWPENLQALCRRCNVSKGTKTMEEWLACRAKEE
jgi:5-methylcytosine-specific restriction endonuclease McrA